ncbi:DUF2330 domain-containing protein [Yinghuangia seranimata]|uniref:DUF2330 domain-containing protein n=1 Tax=Yinghuangia seranimata TaxID=408067 RepID=UPI00248C63B0|nr:DUF2330 domain-containing protein [Yinghuangia seranimata]MDI2126399.1 DUF2330 domain-containing protein [Yinghuangia seranimata]
MKTRRWTGAAPARWLTVLLLVVGIQLGGLVRPAWACGCGAAVPAANTTFRVTEETSAVRWDGRAEDIMMRLTVAGNSDKAAWIMPVPTRATVALGDDQLFSRLGHVVEPVEETRHYFWPREGDWPFTDRPDHESVAGAPRGGGEAAGAPPVSVVGSGRLGPFEFVQLAATDPAALESWLGANGFSMPDGLAQSLRPYVDQHWEYVAVKLAPDTRGKVLSGPMDPLRISFASDRLVYPMRLSQRAKNPQQLRLYVFAPHRVEAVADIGGGGTTELLYAGKPDADDVRWPGEGLGAAPYLTAMARDLSAPSTITGDFEFRPAAKDTRYHRVKYRDELLTVGGVPVWLMSVLGPVVLLVAWWAVRARRRHVRLMASYPPPPPLRPL